jgi:hypothetical protein
LALTIGWSYAWYAVAHPSTLLRTLLLLCRRRRRMEPEWWVHRAAPNGTGCASAWTPHSALPALTRAAGGNSTARWGTPGGAASAAWAGSCSVGRPRLAKPTLRTDRAAAQRARLGPYRAFLREKGGAQRIGAEWRSLTCGRSKAARCTFQSGLYSVATGRSARQIV